MGNYSIHDKTKAKKRYLKRKKDRRKSQKSAAPEKVIQATATIDNNEDERPRKRCKLLPDYEQNLLVGDSHLEVRFGLLEVRRSPTPLAMIPSLPLPELPNAPPKSMLALQGIDQALVDAEVVDPTTVLPMDSHVDVEGNIGLGEKTRERLKELGITELFAGELSLPIFQRLPYWLNHPVQTVLLPFLLPPSKVQRSLYLPYDPPRDVCVSAPTGSGKTLAYVLPIIEVSAGVHFSKVYRGR